jgi:hypothetical protein
MVVDIAGTPAQNVQVEFIDSLGHQDLTQTNDRGKYVFAPGSDRVAPYLIVSGGLTSCALPGWKTANVNGFADLETNLIYQAQGTSVASQALGTPLAITLEQVQAVTAIVNDGFEARLGSLAPSLNFNFFTAPLKKSYVQLLRTSVFSGAGTATESVDSTVASATVTFTANAGTQSLWMLSHVTTTLGQSTSSDWTLVPSGGAAAAYRGVNTFAVDVASVINARKQHLANSDFDPFFDSGYREDGKNFTVSKDWTATIFRGSGIKISTGTMFAFAAGVPDADHNTIGVTLETLTKLAGKPSLALYPQVFKCNSDGSGCLLYGNQAPARTFVDFVWTSTTGPSTPSQAGALNAFALSWTGTPDGTIASGTVSDQSHTFFNGANLVSAGLQTITLRPTPTTVSSAAFDVFVASTNALPPNPDYADPFTFGLSLTNPSGAATTMSRAVGFAIESIVVMRPAPDAPHTIEDARPGGSLKVEWQLPTTFIPRLTLVYGDACNSHGTQPFDSTKPLGPSSVSATVKVPGAIGGDPPVGADVFIETTGLYGQHLRRRIEFGIPCSF